MFNKISTETPDTKQQGDEHTTCQLKRSKNAPKRENKRDEEKEETKERKRHSHKPNDKNETVQSSVFDSAVFSTFQI